MGTGDIGGTEVASHAVPQRVDGALGTGEVVPTRGKGAGIPLSSPCPLVTGFFLGGVGGRGDRNPQAPLGL